MTSSMRCCRRSATWCSGTTPFQRGSRNDPGLLLALGKIAGRAEQALREYETLQGAPTR
jgi:hypothetical protein